MAKRKRSYDGEATRARILDAAADVFQRQGYHATSMQDLLAAAGVPGGSMYHFFPTKKSLALGVIEERVMRSLHETWIAPVTTSGTVSDAVAHVFDSVSEQIDARGYAIGCPVTNLAVELSGVDADFANALGAAYGAWEAAIRERLAKSARAALRGKAGDTAALVVSAFAGAMALAKTTRSSKPLRQCVKRLLPLLDGA